MAERQLFERHRPQLKRMIAVRMDSRLAVRLDPSDVVQDALTLASQRLAVYLQEQAIPFYPWLRRLAWERLIQLQRHHVQRSKRSVLREQQASMLSDRSAAQLVEHLVASETSPSGRLLRRERLDEVRQALESLSAEHREVLVLRHLEELSVDQTAAVLGVSAGAVKSRHFRAIAKLHEILPPDD